MSPGARGDLQPLRAGGGRGGGDTPPAATGTPNGFSNLTHRPNDRRPAMADTPTDCSKSNPCGRALTARQAIRHFRLVRTTRLTVVLFLAAALTVAADLDFWRENIAVRITACDTIEVTGDYFFRNTAGTDLTTGLYYPLPVDSLGDFPSRISVLTGDSTPVVYTRSGAGVTFPVTVPASGVCSLRVMYIQHVRRCSGRYILTTTSAWGKPLGPSNYSVALPSAITLSHLSYEADSVTVRDGWTTYRFFRDSFMPTQDLTFRWQAACCTSGPSATVKRARGTRADARR